MRNLIFLFSIMVSLNFSAQNYEWLKLKKYKLATLSDSLKETSGLAFWHGNLLTINDGGNSSEIFEIDKKSGKILKIIKTNLTNTDWEAIATDSASIYIGDFGNNFGNRKDLKVFKIKKEKGLCNPFNQGAPIFPSKLLQTYSFTYPTQTDFTRNGMQTDFDAEGLFVKNEIPHIFTKEWKSGKVSHYELQNSLNKIEETNIGFLVTDVYYYQSKLYAVGYTKKGEVFLSVFNEVDDGRFFTKPYKKFYLGSALSVGQVEGIAVNSEGIYISAEEFNLKFIKTKPALYLIPKRDLNLD